MFAIVVVAQKCPYKMRVLLLLFAVVVPVVVVAVAAAVHAFSSFN